MQTNIKKLSERPTEGIYLIESHAKLIWENKKSLIITSKLYPEMIYRSLYLLGDNLCYGIIELKQPKQINLDQFNELSSAHQINKENREKWWPKQESLFAYPYDIIEFYDKPQKMQLSKEIQTSIKDIQFLEFSPSANTEDTLSLTSGFQPIWIEGKKKKLLTDDDIKEKYIRIEQISPDKYIRFRIIDIDPAKGIKAVLGVRKDNKSEVQSYLFIKEKWTEERARAWVQEHKTKKNQEQAEKELFVRKRGDRWCVTHSDGRIIKCFPVKAQAEAMHKAIIISKIKRGEMSESNPLNIPIS